MACGRCYYIDAKTRQLKKYPLVWHFSYAELRFRLWTGQQLAVANVQRVLAKAMQERTRDIPNETVCHKLCAKHKRLRSACSARSESADIVINVTSLPV
jgi:hypothetical protein